MYFCIIEALFDTENLSLYDIDYCNMEKEKHVVEGSTQKNLALDPEKQKEFKKNNKEIKSKVVFVIYG